MNLSWRLLAVFLISGIPQYAGACPIRYRSAFYAQSYISSYVQPVTVVQPIAVATYVPIAVAQYGVGYAPQQVQAPVQQVQAPMAQQVQQDPCAQLRQELQALRAEIQQIRQGVGLPAKAPPEAVKGPVGEHPAVGIFRTKCAACHEAKVAKEEAKGFVLLHGDQMAQLTDRQALRVAAYAYAGKMPPPGNLKKIPPLTDEEVGKILAWADSLK